MSTGADVAAQVGWLTLQGQGSPGLHCLQELPRLSRMSFIVLMHESPF